MLYYLKLKRAQYIKDTAEQAMYEALMAYDNAIVSEDFVFKLPAFLFRVWQANTNGKSGPPPAPVEYSNVVEVRLTDSGYKKYSLISLHKMPVIWDDPEGVGISTEID